MNSTRPATIRRKAIAMMVVILSGAPFLHAATQPVPGVERRWALDFRTRLEQPNSARPVEIHISGDWTLTISAARSGEYDAALQLTNARINATGSASADQVEQFQRRMARPFWATYRSDGSLIRIHFYRDTDPSDRNLLQMIATECQFVQAASDRTSWTTIERDGAGEYQAVYERSARNIVTKRRVKYIASVAQDKSSRAPIDVERSEFRFSLDIEGGMAAMDAATRVRVTAAPGAAGQIVIATEMHLAGFRNSQSAEGSGSLARALPNVVSSPVQAHQPDPELLRARLDNQILEGHNTHSLLAAALADTGKANAEDPLLQDRLAALFRERSQAPAVAVELLRKNGAHSRITDALGAAGSPAAIEALDAIARDGIMPRALRIDALTAFIVMQHPSVQAMQAPVGLLDDRDAAVASAARMAGGALARSGRADHPEQAGMLDASLGARFRKTQNAEEQSQLLAAMGNSAGKTVLPMIEDALRDPREMVRTAAVRALRLADDPAVDGLLAATIRNDQDAGVRAAAIFAAGFRNPLGIKLGAALVQAAKSDSAHQVRVGAINLLRQHVGSIPNVAETLVWLVQHDAQPGVRQLAQEALKGAGSAPRQ